LDFTILHRVAPRQQARFFCPINNVDELFGNKVENAHVSVVLFALIVSVDLAEIGAPFKG